MKKLSLPYQLMLLIAAVLVVYYPTQFAEISLVDDAGVISSLLNCGPISLADIFTPSNAEGGYYRPLIGLSYLLDRRLWFLDERLLHFEFILAHLLNGVLVFFFCSEAVRQFLGKRPTYVPLAAGLLFSLHPITTESVNWISGRTDIMMGNFVLLSAYLLLRYRRTCSLPLLVLSVASAFMALLAKEAAFGWLPGFTLLLLYRPAIEESPKTSARQPDGVEWTLFAAYFIAAFLTALFFRSFCLVVIISLVYLFHCIVRLRILAAANRGSTEIRGRIMFLLIAFVAAAILFFIVRRIAFSSDISKIGQTLALMRSDVNYTISMFLGASGFYLKKFLVPIPLNFFIREIDPLYDFLGIAVLLAALRLFLSRNLPALFFLMGLFLMLPALPFAFGTIAWTAYAERYIYLSTAFWIVAVCLWTGRWMQTRPTCIPLFSGVVVALCLLSAGVTFARNRIWLTNVDLMADTVTKSPNQRKLRDIYMYALLRVGRVEEAKKEYRVSCSIHDIFYDPTADLVMGEELRKEGRYSEAMQLYREALQRSKNNKNILVAAIAHIRRMDESESVTLKERRALAELERDYKDRLHKITEDHGDHGSRVNAAQREDAQGEFSSIFDGALYGATLQEFSYPLWFCLRDETRRNDRIER
jgi:tetratricopeptide (TPR) repeat protein